MGLIVEQINKSFGNFKAITDLSMEVKEGKSLAFWGRMERGRLP